MEIKTDALMLKSTDYKENDRILTLFTLEKGKIAAGARGVKKAGAKLRFAAQPFCFAEYILAEKNGRHTVISASLTESFYGLRDNLLKFYCAYAITDFCDNFLYEGNRSPKLFILALNSLKELCYQSGGERGVLIKFLIDALEIAGYGMNFSECGMCGGELTENLYFDFDTGSAICGDCGKGKKLSYCTYKVINLLQSGGYTELLRDAEGETRAVRLMDAYIKEKAGIELKSLPDIETKADLRP